MSSSRRVLGPKLSDWSSSSPFPPPLTLKLLDILSPSHTNTQPHRWGKAAGQRLGWAARGAGGAVLLAVSLTRVTDSSLLSPPALVIPTCRLTDWSPPPVASPLALVTPTCASPRAMVTPTCRLTDRTQREGVGVSWSHWEGDEVSSPDGQGDGASSSNSQGDAIRWEHGGSSLSPFPPPACASGKGRASLPPLPPNGELHRLLFKGRARAELPCFLFYSLTSQKYQRSLPPL